MNGHRPLNRTLVIQTLQAVGVICVEFKNTPLVEIYSDYPAGCQFIRNHGGANLSAMLFVKASNEIIQPAVLEMICANLGLDYEDTF